MQWFACSLHAMGKAGTIKINTDTMPKLDDCGVHHLFVGYLLMTFRVLQNVLLKNAQGVYFKFT